MYKLGFLALLISEFTLYSMVYYIQWYQWYTIFSGINGILYSVVKIKCLLFCLKLTVDRKGEWEG
jgi:hypothetical protein